MKRTLLLMLVLLSTQGAIAQDGDKPGWRNGLPPTTLDSFQLVQAPIDPQRAAMVQKLYEFTQDKTEGTIVPVRGGTAGKMLGCYINSNKVIFNSGYKDVDPRTQCEWAYDLHKFCIDNGGGWDNLLEYRRELKTGSDLEESIQNYSGAKNPNDPIYRAHVPYDKQTAFADKWWKERSQSYSTAIVPPSDWWTHDAVLDGNNLWTRWEQLNEKYSSDYASWRDLEMSTLMQKK